MQLHLFAIKSAYERARANEWESGAMLDAEEQMFSFVPARGQRGQTAFICIAPCRKCSANQQTLTQLQSRPLLPAPIDRNYFRCLCCCVWCWCPAREPFLSLWRIIQITCIICFNNFHQSSCIYRGVRRLYIIGFLPLTFHLVLSVALLLCGTSWWVYV